MPKKKSNDPLYIDWSIVFPDDYSYKFKIHEGVFWYLIIGAVVSFLLILVGVKMHQFYKKLKLDVQILNDKVYIFDEDNDDDDNDDDLIIQK